MRMVKERLCSRKLKKAIKNYPCRKTRLGRYVINACNSCYEEHYISHGYDAYDVVYDCFKFHQIANIINGKLSFVIRYPDYDDDEIDNPEMNIDCDVFLF